MSMPMSPPTSPADKPRPRSALMRPPRSNSRMSTSSKQGGSRTSDEDVKTSVQVAVRIRPPLKPTDPGFDLIPQRFQKSMVHVTAPTSLAVDSPQGRKLFVFDRVFGEDVLQDGIWDYICGSVESFLQGYNVSVMAYGQSGAGKSFTMGTSGPSEQSDAQLMGGIVPRAAAALFAKLRPSPPGMQRMSSGLRNPSRYSMSSVPAYSAPKPAVSADQTWQLKATYVEIYNEQLRDLLLPESVPAHERQTVTIREDTKGRIILTGLQQVTINSAEDLLDALNAGSTVRQTDSTAINARSSRSHAVFSLNLVQRKNKTQETSLKDKRMSMPTDTISADSITVDSKLHFVDLAGSERLKNTGASGERAREGISINAGLASLGKVISQLSSRSAGAHVSYRDSRLTRLLQDSLGGNAITYMIACVTPAEFHLSETLNTVQYAQRARAIQTKPQIQQVDDGDKQAVIDRLRAEIQFLRDQIRNSDRLGKPPQVESQRQIEREIDLENRLLDVEENYSALSQRHAKLISEITKGTENDGRDVSLPNGTAGESAVERLKRSTSFADAVEQVVLEYEKTIQSLETSLSKTRSSLSTSESSLLEKETKCAYVETLNQQLQSRIQKLIDRETNNERYIRDMESKLDGVVSGEERGSVMVTDLRKEVFRLRETENTSEEYIASLEDRLAESDKSLETLQREIARLEVVVDRQRSVGRLDNLLHELDHGMSKPNGIHITEEKPLPIVKAKAEPIEELAEEDILEAAASTPIPDTGDLEEARGVGHESKISERQSFKAEAKNQAQTNFLQEKLEVVNQELFDLRVDHENALGDLDLLSAKYEEALRTLAALQDSVEESRRAPPSPIPFLLPAEVNNGQRGGRPSSSRSLSLELSSAGHSTEATELMEEGSITPREPSRIDSQSASKEIDYPSEADHTERSSQDGELPALQQKYDDLHEQHLDTLDLVEELKSEIQKVKLTSPLSPLSPSLIRRKSSQNLLNVDRAHRSLASLGNIAAENFSDNPDLKDSFEISLNSVTHELHQRTERVQVLESELAAAKKEMETKMAIISGLTRERSSLKSSSPVEMSMMATMQDQVVDLERQLRARHESAASREEELRKEIGSLKDVLTNKDTSKGPATSTKDVDTPGTSTNVLAAHDSTSREHGTQVTELQAQIAHWQDKHQIVVDSMQASEQRLLSTITELEETLSSVETLRQTKANELESLTNTAAAAAAASELEREKYERAAQKLNKDIESRKEAIGAQADKLANLERAYAQARHELQRNNEFKQLTLKSLDDHQVQISSLEKEIEQHKASVEFHKHGLISLHDARAREIEARRASVLRQAETDSEALIADLSARHLEKTAQLHKQIQDLEVTIREREAQLGEQKRQFEERTSVIESLKKENRTHSRSASEATDELKEAKAKLRLAEEAQSRAERNLTEAEARVEELQWAKSELNDELVEIREKEQRASRLVEALEGQLHNSFEDSRNTTNRLSQLQNTRDQELVEARVAAERAQEEASALRSRIEILESGRGRASPLAFDHSDRSSSLNSQVRGKHNVASLPSPPPTQPLPPIPTSPRDSRTNGASSPISYRSSQQAQQLEEREARLRATEKHLAAEKKMTKTLEGALEDLDNEVTKSRHEVESWKKRVEQYEIELTSLRKERQSNRQSLQQIEQAKIKQREAEIARAHLEEKMMALSKKGKKNGLSCF